MRKKIQKITLLMVQKQFSAALALIEEISDDFLKRKLKASCYLRQGNPQKTLTILKDAQKDHDLNYLRASAYLQLEDYEKALDNFKEALKQQKDSAAVFEGIGDVFLAVESIAEALVWYAKAYALERLTSLKEKIINNIWIRSGKCPDCEAEKPPLKPLAHKCGYTFKLRQQLPIFSQPEIVKDIAQRALFIKRFPDALRVLFVLENSTDPEIINLLGTTYFCLEHYEKAKLCFLKAAELNPAMALAHLNLGDVHDLLGEKQKSKKAYRQVLKLKPEWKEKYAQLMRGLA